MKVKLDENIAVRCVTLLREKGYDADRVHEEGMSGFSDEKIWQRVCAEKRFLITLDLDFADLRKYPPHSHPGILLIRTKLKSAKAVYSILDKILRETSLETLSGKLSVADETHTRTRS